MFSDILKLKWYWGSVPGFEYIILWPFRGGMVPFIQIGIAKIIAVYIMELHPTRQIIMLLYEHEINI